MPTVGSIAYAITADTRQLTGGVTASRRELRALKQAFDESRTPVQRYSNEIAALEALQRKFPASAAALQRSIDQTKAKMAEATRPTTAMSTLFNRLPIVVDPVSASFRAFSEATQLARTALNALLDIAHRVGDAMQRLDDLSDRAQLLGISESALTGLSGAAKVISGVDQAGTERALQSFSRRLAQAAMTGQGPGQSALERLGLDAQALSGMTLDKALLEVADAMQKVENPSERMQLAFQLLGDNGRELATTLAAGGDEINRLADEAIRLTQSDFIDHRAIGDANDAWDRLQMSLEGIVNVLASDFAPLVESISNDLAGGLAESDTNAQALRDTIRGIALTAHELVEDIKAISEATGRFNLGGAAFGPIGMFLDMQRRIGEQSRTDIIGGGAGTTVGEIGRTIDPADDARRQERIIKQLRDMEVDAVKAVQQARERLERARERASEHAARETERLRASEMADIKRLEESLRTPTEVLKDDLHRLMAMRGGPFGLDDETFRRGLESLAGRAEGLTGGGPEFTGPRTIGAIRAGSVEALRSQFDGGKGPAEKTAKATEKTAAETEAAKRLLQEIRDRLAATAVREVP